MFELGGGKTWLCVDLDGTLVKLNGDWTKVHELIKPFTSVIKASEKAVIDDNKKFFEELSRLELANQATPLKLIEFIKQLNPNISKFMITNNTTETGESIDKNFDLRFNKVIGIDKVPKGKPDPSGILELMQKYKLNPKDGYFIGNERTDRQAAEKAGLSFISAYLFNE